MMNNMSKNQSILLLVTFLTLLFILTSCDLTDSNSDDVSNTDHEAKAEFSYDIPIENQVELDLEAVNGSVHISGKSDITSVRIWGERKVSSESVSDAQEHLNYLQVEVTEGEERISVKTVQPNQSNGRSYVVDYYIYLPPNWNLMVIQVNGEIEVNNSTGETSIQNVNGNIQLNNITGNIVSSLVNGNINGTISLPQEGICYLSTVNGVIQIAIPGETSAEFLAQVVNGSINVTDLVLNNMSSSSQKLSGTLGNGDGDIDLSTVNGSIDVSGL